MLALAIFSPRWYFWICVQHTYTGKRDDLRRTPPRRKSKIKMACTPVLWIASLPDLVAARGSRSLEVRPHAPTGSATPAVSDGMGVYLVLELLDALREPVWDTVDGASAATTAYHARIPILAHLPGQRRGEPYALLTSRVERGLRTCDLEVDVQLLILMIVNPVIQPPDQ